MYVLGLPACLRAALSRSVVVSHVGHTRAARGGAFGVERPETPFQTIIGTRNRDRSIILSLGFALQRANVRMLRGSSLRRRRNRAKDCFASGSRSQ